MDQHRYLITGASGFVAPHFLRLLQTAEPGAQVLGVDLTPPAWSGAGVSTRTLNLLDRSAVEAVLQEFRPTRVLHLASVSSVAVSWKSPVESFQNNTNIFLHLLEGLRKFDLGARVLSVGSSEEYGRVGPEDLPLKETHPLAPGSPYGVARVAQEQLSKVFAEGFGQDIVMTRSFNHLGPGQKAQFVVSSFAKQMADAKKAGTKNFTLTAGNTKVVRDFLDVRDVVRAYFDLFNRGVAGEVYNVCSGVGRSLDEVLALLADIAGLELRVETDPALVRPNELMEIVGSAEKIRAAVGWQPTVNFERSLNDLFAYWEKQ
jgi:GDP-4-dehydro-6-deoxy-D-mannose reductase